MLKKLDHIGIAVDNLEASVKKYEQLPTKSRAGEKPALTRLDGKLLLNRLQGILIFTVRRRHELLFPIDF